MVEGLGGSFLCSGDGVGWDELERFGSWMFGGQLVELDVIFLWICGSVMLDSSFGYCIRLSEE